jgi:hypothetical protein
MDIQKILNNHDFLLMEAAVNKKYGVKILGCCSISVEHLKYIVRNINSGKPLSAE